MLHTHKKGLELCIRHFLSINWDLQKKNKKKKRRGNGEMNDEIGGTGNNASHTFNFTQY